MSYCLLQFIQLVRLQMAVDKLDKNYGKYLAIQFLFDGVRIWKCFLSVNNNILNWHNMWR